MPLVIPGLQSSGGNDELSQWNNKLMGKKLGDSHDATTFAKVDLPKEHRVLGPDSVATMDFKPDRLNIHTDKDGIVKDIKHG